ncbi:5-oxoprolinase subunit PxpB [Gaetbulibacter saemankumensis]|uniref:5-oxoprolinase subunit PxpB n=1 Tax=Gaetbulibacter saemankumensis TaxID=311208 RepID=UPI000416CBA9|nr:5-oxoprolinase subunit PxpB [Gaetbulibacter saemankumensis]
MSFNLKYKPYGEYAILIEWPSKIQEDILYDILKFKHKIIAENIDGILELKSAYNSLLVVCDKEISDLKSIGDRLKTIYTKEEVKDAGVDSVTWIIPVCYDFSFGLDLKQLSEEKNITVEEIIKKHSETIYTVYFVGFLPGFLYLGGLDDILHTPRKAMPRMQIEKGAVAIGGKQTGIYPVQSPGGWNIIGNTPVSFFDPQKETPCFAKAGDKIVFKPITLKAYGDIKILADAGVYQIEIENGHD